MAECKIEESSKLKIYFRYACVAICIIYAVSSIFEARFAPLALFRAIFYIFLGIVLLPATPYTIEKKIYISMIPRGRLVMVFIVLISVAFTLYIEPDDDPADAKWLEAYSDISNTIENDLSDIEEAERNADRVALSNAGSALYYDSLEAIEENNRYNPSTDTLELAQATTEGALTNSRDAGLKIISGVYELNQGRTSEYDKYLKSATLDISTCTSDMRFIDVYIISYKRDKNRIFIDALNSM